MLKDFLLEFGIDPKAALAAFAGAACSIFLLRQITVLAALGTFTVGFWSAQYLVEYAPLMGLKPSKGLVFILALSGMLICQGINQLVGRKVRQIVASRTNGGNDAGQ